MPLCSLVIFLLQNSITSPMISVQSNDIDYFTTVCNIYSDLSSLLERKGSTLPALTNTSVMYFLSLQLTLLIFPSNVWWPVARRVIARNVGSYMMSEEN